jgi:cytochrome d ubiquinol oxidase subunit I
MKFNPETARMEMASFWDVLFSTTAISKYIHTTTSGFVLAAVFVVGISCWFILKKRHLLMAKRSIIIASVFGIVASFVLIVSGDSSAREMAKIQPMKFAAMEALYQGQTNAPLIGIGVMGKTNDDPLTKETEENFLMKIEVPNMLSYMAFLKANAFVPGVMDLVLGNENHGILSVKEKIKRGYVAQQSLKLYKESKKNNPELHAELVNTFNNQVWLDTYFKYFGYGSYYDDDPNVLEANAFKMVPPVSMSFYAFRIMVGLGMHFLALFIVLLVLVAKKKIERYRFILWTAVWTIPLVYIASEAGWIVAEAGRQPWVIQDLMTTMTAVSNIDSTSVIVTFWLFAVLFTGLFIAEIGIMFKQIKVGPKDGGHK